MIMYVSNSFCGTWDTFSSASPQVALHVKATNYNTAGQIANVSLHAMLSMPSHSNMLRQENTVTCGQLD